MIWEPACRRTAGRSAVPDDPAFVCAVDTVVDARCAVAAAYAAPKISIEPLQYPGRDLGHGLLAECRTDMHAQVDLVALPGRILDLMGPKPLLNGGAKRGLGAGLALLVDLRAEPVQDALRLVRIRRRLVEVDAPAGQRVPAGVHQHAVGVAPLDDGPLRASLPRTLPGRGASIAATISTAIDQLISRS